MKDARTRARRTAKEDAKARANLNTIPADLIGTGGKKMEKDREREREERGRSEPRSLECPKVRSANKRDERKREIKIRADQTVLQPCPRRWTKERQTGKEETKYRRGRRRDKRKKNGEEDPGTRMQIDAVTHDATARESHTKSRRS